MAEQYTFTINNFPSVIEGKFFKLINNKHKISYGDSGATNILNNVRSTYISLLSQLEVQDNHNSLLVGKVQSGKTSNLELLTALAFDNGFNLLVILGGYDTDLLKQCTERFGISFDSVSGDDFLESAAPAVFTTNEKTKESIEIDCLNVKIAKQLISSNRPIIITCLKRPVALRKTIKILKTLVDDIPVLKPFIIDDEGDQASLNVAKDKQKEATATYASIKYMKDVLKNPLYLSVTATPEANIFLDSYSVLKPSSIHLIQPGSGYNGASVYHLADNDIVEIVDAPISDSIFPDSLNDAIFYFLIASAIKRKNASSIKEKCSDMIIHSDRTTKEHKKIYSHIFDQLLEIEQAFIEGETFYFIKKFEYSYKKYLSEELQNAYPLKDIIDNIREVVEDAGVILQNSKGKQTKKNEQYKLHKIYVGGDLLQRGLTFKNLIVSYFTRNAKSGGNMDTTLQRARWFGYRSKYLHLCKIFTTEIISQDFSKLAEIEDDLWDQFEEIEKGRMIIDDILISADNTRLKPTAPNKAKYKNVSFKHRWIKQKFIVTDNILIEKNNQYLESLISNTPNWTITTEGSVNGCINTGQYAEFSHAQLIELIKSINTAFDREPLYRNPLIDAIGNSGAIVILMWQSGEEPRFRSVYDSSDQDRIKALHQGANTRDEEKLKYQGDKKVIVDPSKINIQIHHIAPGIKHGKNITKLDKDQYMFAIYLPKENNYYIKDND